MNPNNKQGPFLGPKSNKPLTVKSSRGITKPTNSGWTHGNGPINGATEQERNDNGKGYPTE
jgi:hypothetical protein